MSAELAAALKAWDEAVAACSRLFAIKADAKTIAEAIAAMEAAQLRWHAAERAAMN